MKIGLIDLGSKRFPNIALMKLSAHHKSAGDVVEWYDPMFAGHFDKVYVSKVFSWSPDYPYPIDADEVVKGGSGYAITLEDGREVFRKEKERDLPSEIEHIYPDYSLYPTLTQDTAFGFLTRGCPRGCDFCIVGKKEGRKSIKVADLAEFWNGQKKIVLCDPNILACRQWAELLDQLREAGAEVDFNQGLDCRLLTEEKIEALNALRLTAVRFAWDRLADRDKVLPKLELYARLGLKKVCHNKMVYVLCNFDSTLEEDLDRIYTLRDLGYWPYVTVYDLEHAHPEYKRLQRWCNNRWVFGVVKRFEDYK